LNTAVQFLDANRIRLRLDERGFTTPFSSVMLTPRFEASRHVVFLLFARQGQRPVLVAKMPRLQNDGGALKHEATILQALPTSRLEPLSTPAVIAYERFDGWPILVETAIDGRPMDPAEVRRDADQCVTRVVEWLANLHHASAAPASASWSRDLVDGPLEYFTRTFPLSSEESWLVSRTHALVAPLRDAGLPFVCEHGDLGHPNLLLRDDGHIGVIDWELASLHGLVAYDLFFFLTFAAFSLARAQSSRRHVEAFAGTLLTPDAPLHRFVVAYARRCDIALSLMTPLLVLCWARYTITLLRRLSDSENPRATPGQAAWLRSNRYYALWRYVVGHADRLSWSD